MLRAVAVAVACSWINRDIQAHSYVQNTLPDASAVPAPHLAPNRCERAQWAHVKTGVIRSEESSADVEVCMMTTKWMGC